MLTDEVKINIHAGKGGDGVVAFDKVMMSLGPTGGKGGNGGSVYFEGVSDLTALNKYRNKRDYYAEDGKNGGYDRSTGRDGKDLTLTVPLGSVLHNSDTEEKFEITKTGEKILAAKGGIGGRGNMYFKSPGNTSPQESEEGKPGAEFQFLIELRLIADVGLVGLPNAGKSSLLNELTKANAKVGNYEFTTLEPNLGVLDGIVIADIPGLIEGASTGKGLGIKFLKHIQRTKMLVHCISSESDDPARDYGTVRKELGSYNKELLAKKELVLLTKTDIFSKEEIAEKIKKISRLNKNIEQVSIHDWDGMEKLKKLLLKSKI